MNSWPFAGAGRMSLVGLTEGGRGYEMGRQRPPTGHVVVGYGGWGEVWVGEAWRRCGEGEAYVSPAGKPMGFRTVGKTRWRFAWAYLPAAEGVADEAPFVAKVDPRPIVNAIEGLYLEAAGLGRVDMLDRWAELAYGYLQEITNGSAEEDPLRKLWTTVDGRLGDSWTLGRLTREAKLRPEALRRLALKTTGRSPMKQVAHLRMRRAEALLRSTEDKLFSIAQQVGYRNVFAFSTAFRRWKGKAPNECRGDR